MLNKLKLTINTLLDGNIKIAEGHKVYIDRVRYIEFGFEEFKFLKKNVKVVKVSDKFIDIIKYFNVKEGITPAGFCAKYELKSNGLLEIDLERDISYDENSVKRPTKFLFSADTANPYELEHIKDLICNLTCNPGIIYDLFINNPEANIGNKFKTRDDVIIEIGRILGPGCDISVEINDPFADLEDILKEAEHFKELLSEYRLVIKVPHTGPVNRENVAQLLSGDKKLNVRYNQGTTKDYLRGHNLALELQKRGYRVNYTLMFEPWQTGMALQAKPYFINSFIRQRFGITTQINGLMTAFEKTRDLKFLNELKQVMLQWDILSAGDKEMDLMKVHEIARELIAYRKINESEGFDGMDGVRHNLRMLKNSNLKNTRLIICSIEGSRNYPELDKLLAEEEFQDVIDRVVITTEPKYLAEFTSSPQIITYQRRFMNAVANDGN